MKLYRVSPHAVGSRHVGCRSPGVTALSQELAGHIRKRPDNRVCKSEPPFPMAIVERHDDADPARSLRGDPALERVLAVCWRSNY
jgi:hypothetical protein